MFIRSLFILFLSSACSSAYALSGFVTAGYGRGGDALSEATGRQNYNTHAGDGLYLTGGLLVPVSPTVPHRFEAQLGVGYLFQNDARSEENSTSWSRVPIEAIYFYRNTTEMFRFGWGATYQVANKISAKGTNASAAASVDNALGWLITAEKLFTNFDDTEGFWGVGLRYTMIKYRSSSFSRDVDGNCLSLTISAAFL